ncbi:hypothetical protein JQ574_17535 [Bradyrhizobium sp. AUGA SZCCT0158]|nr:hypothetical protein [Bradyrhizobium sp. AUGA SZCCT0158]MBR1197801.1 hypothetical protein [Bradyrhizobium sp. AUGA SZCCT0158]
MVMGIDYSHWLVQGDEIKRLVYQDSSNQEVARIYLTYKIVKAVVGT